MTKIGIDPGVDGAIAVVGDDNRLVATFDMPCMLLGKNKRQVNAAELANILWEESACLDAIAYVEQVSAMPGQGVSGMFNFGVSYGVVQGVLAALKIPMVLIRPAVWKKRAGLLGKDKEAARTLAQQLYPEAPLGRKRDIGRADAILIARYGEEKTNETKT